jgi:hypothetical protein
LKKLINQVVNELAALGLRPSVLQGLLEQSDSTETRSHNWNQAVPVPECSHESLSYPRVVYEFSSSSNSIEPRVRLRVKSDQPEALGLQPVRESHLISESDAALSEGGSLDNAACYTQITSPKYVPRSFIITHRTHPVSVVYHLEMQRQKTPRK